jgi:hypothetical protein
MGKSSRRREKVGKSEREMTAAEQLQEAAARDKKAREQELAEGCPPKADLLASLDCITLFDIRVVEDGRAKQTCLSPEGDYIFYVDVNDAASAMEARKLTHPGHLALGTTPLGRAFGLTEGQTFGFKTNASFPMYIQGSTAAIDDLVQAGLDAGAKSLCPRRIREQLNQKTSAIPLFSLEELVEGTETAPYFFTKQDMVQHWTEKTGKTQEELPGKRLLMTDLRVLIVRMMSEPRDWKTLKLIPMGSTAALVQKTAVKASEAAPPPDAAAPPPLADEEEPPPLS